jgi:hypothetical protein
MRFRKVLKLVLQHIHKNQEWANKSLEWTGDAGGLSHEGVCWAKVVSSRR